MTARRQPVPAVIVPDAGAWAMWGRDLTALGFRSAATPEHAELLIGPGRVPDALSDAVRAAWRLLPVPKRHVALDDVLRGGAPLAEVVRTRDEQRDMDHGDTDQGDMDHGDMDHGDMMAITGEPSADGLVMDAADFELGPLSSPLPGGLVARVSLDGDVVAGCTVEALLRAPAANLGPDPLTPAAWTAAVAVARGDSTGWGERLAAVETERALSHLVWLWRLGSVLGWPQLADAALDAVRAVLALERDTRAASRSAERVADLLHGSRRLRSRTRGVAVLTALEAREAGLAGPNARASGSSVDARDREPAYAAAGFDPVVLERGDAESRVLVRVIEAVRALELVARLRDGSPPAPAGIEGPRGPVSVRLAPIGRPVELEAPGSAAACATAGERSVGLEWSRALVTLASFDLSPWRVGS